MSQHIDAIFTNGIFQPQQPVDFADGARVKLTVESNPTPSVEHDGIGGDSDDEDDDLSDVDDLLDLEFMAECRRNAGKALPIEEIRRRLSVIPGSLADDIIADREDRI